jgi:uncharacterized protein
LKHGAIIIFLSLVLVLYSAINLFIFLRLRQALSGTGFVRPLLLCAWLVWALAYPMGRIAEGASHNGLSRVLIVCGSFYLAAMASFFLLFLLSDLVQLGFRILPVRPLRLAAASANWPAASGAAVTAVTLLSLLFGAWNAASVRVRPFDLDVPKSPKGLAELRIAAVSDLHLGTVLGRRHMEKVAEKIRGLDPDVVLFAGDTFDEDLTEAAEQRVAEVIRALPARYGRYAVLGNHEHFHDPRRAAAYLREAGVTVLEDSAAKAAEGVWVIGRKDRQAGVREPVADLVRNIDTKDLRILLDHQPFHLEEAEKNGIDLQVSGHTHYGQLFPFNFITDRVYELSYGYKRKGNTHVVVSCGAGTWGPSVRTAGRTEVVEIRVRFTGWRAGEVSGT